MIFIVHALSTCARVPSSPPLHKLGCLLRPSERGRHSQAAARQALSTQACGGYPTLRSFCIALTVPLFSHVHSVDQHGAQNSVLYTSLWHLQGQTYLRERIAYRMIGQCVFGSSKAMQGRSKGLGESQGVPHAALPPHPQLSLHSSCKAASNQAWNGAHYIQKYM